MQINVTRIMRVLGLGLIMAVFITGCGTPEKTKLPTATSSEGMAGEKEAKSTADEAASASKTLPVESMISANQLDEGIKAKVSRQIVDVREPSEFATGHVPQATNIPLGALEDQITRIAKDKEVILICHNGVRAFAAWQTLVGKGYDPQYLKVLLGGMEQWKNLGSEEITESIGGC